MTSAERSFSAIFEPRPVRDREYLKRTPVRKNTVLVAPLVPLVEEPTPDGTYILKTLVGDNMGAKAEERLVEGSGRNLKLTRTKNKRVVNCGEIGRAEHDVGYCNLLARSLAPFLFPRSPLSQNSKTYPEPMETTHHQSPPARH